MKPAEMLLLLREMNFMKITKYELVVAPAEKIADEVNSFIEEGWQPFGPPTILPPPPEVEEQVDMVFQPMVRYEE